MTYSKLLRRNWGILVITILVLLVYFFYGESLLNPSSAYLVLTSLFFIVLANKINIVSHINYLVFFALVSLAIIEVALRLFPVLWPLHLVGALPPTKQTEVAIAHGLPTETTGEDMIFHYQPHQKIPAYKDFIVDAEGYRNRTEWSNNPDIVILGDSISMAANSSIDIADLFRNDGYTAINLSMGGQSPQQYRDVLVKKIKDREIKPKLVLVVLFSGNDLRDATLYNRVALEGKDYRAYNGSPQQSMQFRKNVFEIERLFIAWEFYSAWKKREEPYLREVRLPYKTFTVGYTWPVPDIEEDGASYGLVENAIKDINRISQSMGANALILLMPPPGPVYATFGSGFESELKNYKKIVRALSVSAINESYVLVDALPNFIDAISSEFLFLNDADTHLNEFGNKVLYDIISGTAHDLMQ